MGRYGVGMVCMLSGGGMSEAMIDRCGKAPGAGSHSLRWTQGGRQRCEDRNMLPNPPLTFYFGCVACERIFRNDVLIVLVGRKNQTSDENCAAEEVFI